MNRERGINVTIFYVAIESLELSAWTEVWEGVYSHVTYQCFQFLRTVSCVCAVKWVWVC